MVQTCGGTDLGSWGKAYGPKKPADCGPVSVTPATLHYIGRVKNDDRVR